MISKKQMFAAVALIAIAMTTIAYAMQFTAAVTITTEKVLYVKDTPTNIKVPAGGAQKETIEAFIALNLAAGNLKKDDTLRIGVELLPLDMGIYEFSTFVVHIKEHVGGKVVATITKNMLADEFEVTVPDSAGLVYYDAELIFVARDKAETTAVFKFGATILSVT
jgi:hypothetical protein